jgi:hypothetical protein
MQWFSPILSVACAKRSIVDFPGWKPYCLLVSNFILNQCFLRKSFVFASITLYIIHNREIGLYLFGSDLLSALNTGTVFQYSTLVKVYVNWKDSIIEWQRAWVNLVNSFFKTLAWISSGPVVLLETSFLIVQLITFARNFTLFDFLGNFVAYQEVAYPHHEWPFLRKYYWAAQLFLLRFNTVFYYL